MWNYNEKFYMYIPIIEWRKKLCEFFVVFLSSKKFSVTLKSGAGVDFFLFILYAKQKKSTDLRIEVVW